MKKMFSNQKGVTIITVTLTVIVMIVILSVVMFYVRNSVHTEQFQNMRADISEIEGKAISYYMTNGVLPIYGLDENNPDNRKTRSQMNGDSEFFNPNDGAEYGKVNLDLIGVVAAYDTTYYINMDSFTVYAIDPISIKGKEYPRPAEKFDKITVGSGIPEWEEECFEAPAEMFEYDSDGVIIGVNREYCRAHSPSYYYSDWQNWRNMIIPAYQSDGRPVTGIAKNAFKNIALNGVLKVPNTIKNIEAGVFASNSNIRYVYLDAVNMDLETFNGCNTIEEIHFGPSTHIPDSQDAQHGFLCKQQNLSKVWIDTMSLGKYAFANCQNLQLIILNDVIEEIPEGCFMGAATRNTTILTTDQVTLEEGKYWPTSYATGTILWPSSLKRIGISAFNGSIGIKKVLNFKEESPNLENIAENAFAGINVPEVILPENTVYMSNSFSYGVKVTGGVK